MPEEETGALQEEQVSQETPTEAPTQEPATQIPDLPPAYQGKSAAELAQMLQDREAVISRQGEEVGNLRNENAYFRAQPQVGNQGQVAGNQPVHPQNPGMGSPVGNVPEYDPYDADSVKKYNEYQQRLLDEKLNRFAAWQQQSQVGSSLSRGQQVIQQNPEYFKGIETETINMVNNLVQSSPNIPAATLENPTTWYGVADMIRGEKSRQTTQPVNPVSPTSIDTPAPVRPNEPEKQMDMGIAQELVDEFYGGDRELATKSARASRERGEK